MATNTYRASKYLANPNMPKTGVDTTLDRSRTRFPQVILNDPKLGTARSKAYQGGRMSEKTHTYIQKGCSTTAEIGIAQWCDHRYLLRRRMSPDKMPEDVPPHIMSAVEDMRAALQLEATHIPYDVEQLVIMHNEAFLRKGFGFDALPSDYLPSNKPGILPTEVTSRLALETAGILMGIRYMQSPLREQVKYHIEKRFHSRMQSLVTTIDDLMSESDLSFADAHMVGRLLEQLLGELPIQPEAPPPPPPIAPLPLMEGGGDAKVPPKRLESQPPRPYKEDVRRSDWDDTVDWSNIGTYRRYDGSISAQLREIVNRVTDGYTSYWRTGHKPKSGWFDYVPPPMAMGFGVFGRYGKAAEKDELLKGDHVVEWGAMKVETPRLTHTTVKPRDCGRDHRHLARESGRVPRFMHRFLSDGRVFSQKKRRRGGIALLCDFSGSMNISHNDIDNILRKIPASIIAGYSGSGATGLLRVLAKDGKRVSTEVLHDSFGYMNVVDLPALQWLAKQGNAGKYWLSDGIVTGIHDSNGPGNYKEVDDFIVANDIYQVHTISKLLKVIFDGEALGRRTLHQHIVEGEELIVTG